MCIIIDANVAHKLSSQPADVDGVPVVNKITQGKLKISIGGQNTEELYKSGLRRWLIEQFRKGNTKQCNNNQIKKEQKHILEKNLCISDDSHIIALASVSKCRLIFTNDQDLIKDFKNRHLLKKPRGAVYSSVKNENLLDYPPCCS